MLFSDTNLSSGNDPLWHRIATFTTNKEAEKYCSGLPDVVKDKSGGQYTCLECKSKIRIEGIENKHTEKGTAWRVEREALCTCNRRKASGKFTCTHKGCGKVFTFKTNMKRHLKTHDKPAAPKKEFKCTHLSCDKVYSTKNAVRDHMKRVHADSLLHTCKACGYSTKIKWHLTRHIKTSSVCSEKLGKKTPQRVPPVTAHTTDTPASPPPSEGEPVVTKGQRPSFTVGDFNCKCGWTAIASFSRNWHTCAGGAGVKPVSPEEKAQATLKDLEEKGVLGSHYVTPPLRPMMPAKRRKLAADTDTESEMERPNLFSFRTQQKAGTWQKARDKKALLASVCG
eukprot:TRINITY_DN6897_c0_g1_i2.p1 TRINITY_DN6897_c0_g1~~TRINITY_DN6897_c0_g1_i2.p1  ORF type:complete len:339 (+),score=87.81 TRINITY_DN6897_c0_g1_i2:1741-2757(+)